MAILPSKKSLQSAWNIASTPEAAQYLAQEFSNKLKAVGVHENFSEIDKQFFSHAEHVDKTFQAAHSGSEWQGKEPETNFHAYQNQLADEAVQFGQEKDVTFDYAISANAEIVRRYHSEGQPLSDSETSQCDTLFNAWLAKYNMVTKNGTIYESNAAGEIKKDQAGNDVRADAIRLKQLVKDDTHGIERFVKEKNSGLTLSAKNQPFQGEAQAELSKGQVAPE